MFSYKTYAELFRRNRNIFPLRNALIEKTGQIIEYVMDDNNRKEFNFNEMCSFSIRYYRVSLYKKKAAIYIYQQVIKKIILRSKIALRKTIDKKYRAEINKYRTPSK
jgi:Tfp pilus assembly ATPase PilU